MKRDLKGESLLWSSFRSECLFFVRNKESFSLWSNIRILVWYSKKSKEVMDKNTLNTFLFQDWQHSLDYSLWKKMSTQEWETGRNLVILPLFSHLIVSLSRHESLSCQEDLWSLEMLVMHDKTSLIPLEMQEIRSSCLFFECLQRHQKEGCHANSKWCKAFPKQTSWV